MAQKEAIAKAPASRPRRQGLGRPNVLTVTGKDPEYYYRVFNDIGDRINTYLENGWETCTKEELQIGDKRVGKATSEDSLAKAQVGGGTTGYVLKIRKEWRDEDEADKQRRVDESERATKEQALNGTYGKLEISRD